MDLITILAIAVGLSFDTFAVSLSFGVVQNRIIFREAVRVAFVMAFFQAGLLIVGSFFGSLMSSFIKAADHWIALIILSFLGVRMIVEAIKGRDDNKRRDYTRTPELIAASVGTSIDALAVGISFALLEIRIWISGLVIGIVTFLAAMTAIRLGKSAGSRLGCRVEILGGLILIGIGIKIFLEHALA
ncbi:MAG TPA: manganese efflux pump MntP family protein [Bacteroidales bacterium]|nr:manganese efflux pump MntP family protein [Bacteroidales bacterium]HPF01622.1 manganese efflux pump MntP family protein [Bacteroidales bacterium]HPJ60570.1 manganese efflux pump MntP family protein [Bacteroidales bacterium]HPR13323.1 manganese efflux pump MntP family protein [Bacteroidales bacterium]HRW85633.1 manganese efflux pump MntP family protein [Bacteroidales bacterium]